MKVTFIRKASYEELIPQDDFIIVKAIVLDPKEFEQFIHEPLEDYSFIINYVDLMYFEQDEVRHCIYVLFKEYDFCT
jgi:hypothetical protein